jgi:hypothetical protein
MKGKNKWVIIYMPNGKEVQYCTTDLGDHSIHIASEIVCEPQEVNIAYKEDGKVIGKAFVGMPYTLEIF